jgi:hypothetical protein
MVDPRGRSPAGLDPRVGAEATATEAAVLEAGALRQPAGWLVVFLGAPPAAPWLHDLLVGVNRVVGLSAGEASGSGEKQAAVSAPSSVEAGLLWASWPRSGARARPSAGLNVSGRRRRLRLASCSTDRQPRTSFVSAMVATARGTPLTRHVRCVPWRCGVLLLVGVAQACFLLCPRQSGGLPRGFGCLHPPHTPLDPNAGTRWLQDTFWGGRSLYSVLVRCVAVCEGLGGDVWVFLVVFRR